MQISLTEEGGHLHHDGEVVLANFADWSYPVRWESTDGFAKARNRYQLAQALRDLRARKVIAFSEAILPDGSRFVVDHELRRERTNSGLRSRRALHSRQWNVETQGSGGSVAVRCGCYSCGCDEG